MRLERFGVERIDAQTHVIHIPPGARHAVFRVIEFAAHLQQIDQRAPCSQLCQTQIALFLLDAAAEHVAIETRHGLTFVAE